MGGTGTGESVGFSVTEAVPVLVPFAWLVAVTVNVCDVTEAGAVYRPVALIVPGVPGGIDQVTAVFDAPVTVAVNCCVCELLNVAVPGVTVTDIGVMVTVAVAVFVGSAWLVAVTVMVCCDATVDGGVYTPVDALIDPGDPPGIDQVTAVFDDPVTVAVKVCVCVGPIVAVGGATETDTGVSVTVAVPVFDGSAWLVAVTVTVCCTAIDDGAVYAPVAGLIDPGDPPGIDQVTNELNVPPTVAVNVCPCVGPSVTVGGATETVTGGACPKESDTIPAGTAPSVVTWPVDGIATRFPAARA